MMPDRKHIHDLARNTAKSAKVFLLAVGIKVLKMYERKGSTGF